MNAIKLFIISTIFALTALADTPRQLCTWDISYYLLGERHHSVSAHSWLLSVDEQAQLFGPFLSGSVFVVPGEANFTCAGRKTEIVTAPLARGSLLELKK